MSPHPERGGEPIGTQEAGLPWAAEPDVASGVLLELAERRRRRSRRRAQLAVGLATVVALAAFLVPFGGGESAAPLVAARSTAHLSMPEKRVLPDGSIVELKEGAVIAVAYEDAVRRVVLSQGEAHFEVARNRTRPFVVTVASLDVRAVGTAFSVGLERGSVAVLVTHGEVAIESSKASAAAAPLPGPGATIVPSLVAGQRVVLAPGGADVETVSPAESSQRLAWRVPRLDFSATPLSEALPIFNAHSSVKVSLADPSLESLQISGIIRADNVESLLRLLESNYQVVAERADGGIVLRSGK